MATKKRAPSGSEQLRKNPSLTVPRTEAADKIMAQIEKGRALRERLINSASSLDEAKNDRSKWNSYTYEMLSRQFDDQSIADSFGHAGYSPIGFVGEYTFHQRVQDYQKDLGYSINNLESLYERLDLIPELSTTSAVRQPMTTSVTDYKKVFIVHGHDNAAKQSAARFIERLGLEAVIFHEQDDMGQTIIEKLERVSDVGYAIVLLTPDDVGHAKSSPENATGRARQNVIFEWGYFMAKLGRKNVSALLSGKVEVLSDLQGILWTQMDDNEAWKLKIGKEMRAVGFDIDMNKI